MEPHPVSPDVFTHVRVIIGIVLGLSISRLLTGLARFVQHPSREAIYPVHIGWAAFLFLAVIHFWWFEFYLHSLPHWSFEIYLFLIFYASLYFLACTLLFPDTMSEYTGYQDYFMSRRKWFFGIVALIFTVDLVDTLIKGMDHYRSFGIEYPIRAALFVGGALLAIFISNRRFHAALVTVALVYEIAFILRQFSTLS